MTVCIIKKSTSHYYLFFIQKLDCCLVLDRSLTSTTRIHTDASIVYSRIQTPLLTFVQAILIRLLAIAKNRLRLLIKNEKEWRSPPWEKMCDIDATRNDKDDTLAKRTNSHSK